MRFVNAKFIAAFLLALALPAVASATYIAGLEPTADCNGWAVDATIRFRAGDYDADAVLTVQLADLDFNVLEEQVVEAELTRDENSYQTQVYSFDGEWTWYGPADRYRIIATLHITTETATGEIHEDDYTRYPKFSCSVVPTESKTWSSVKGMYR